ncbi:MAG: dienelactone hydrolase family protein [Bacteroidota bacterium]
MINTHAYGMGVFYLFVIARRYDEAISSLAFKDLEVPALRAKLRSGFTDRAINKGYEILNQVQDAGKAIIISKPSLHKTVILSQKPYLQLMKNLFLSLIVLCSAKLISQTTCCAKPASTDAFAMLTHDKQFVATHLEPLPFTLANPLGKKISFRTADGKIGYGYEIKAAAPTNNYVFVIHEWWGLNDYVKQESEKWFSALGNVNVIAIDLYDQKVASNRDSAAKYMGQVKTDRAEAIIKGALKYAGPNANIATVGWCFGGGWSLQTSLLAGTQAKACVMYYGAPEENPDKLKTLNAPVIFMWPTQDKWINKELVTKFENNMKTAAKELTVKSYDADHAFANPSNPKYNKPFADDAFTNALAFVREHLK